MKLKATLAAASLVLTTATAGAQSTATKPYPPGFLANVVKQMQSQGQTRRMGPVTSGQSNIGNLAPGFYQFHATNCVAIAVDPTTVAGCIFSQEGFFACELNPPPASAAPAAAACASGNLVGINVIDNAGDINLIISYPVK